MPQTPALRLVELPIRLSLRVDLDRQDEHGVKAPAVDGLMLVDWDAVAAVTHTTRPGDTPEIDPERCSVILTNGDDYLIYATYDHVAALWRSYRQEAGAGGYLLGLS